MCGDTQLVESLDTIQHHNLDNLCRLKYEKHNVVNNINKPYAHQTKKFDSLKEESFNKGIPWQVLKFTGHTNQLRDSADFFEF